MSLADIDEAAFRRYAPDMAHIVDAQQLDYRTAQFLVRPEAHFFCGGVRTDAWGRQRSLGSTLWVRSLGAVTAPIVSPTTPFQSAMCSASGPVNMPPPQ